VVHGATARRLTDAGFSYRYTDAGAGAGAVESFVRSLRLRRSTGRRPASSAYEHDVEQFFRNSPAVVQVGDG
jgi:UDP-glucose 4-epimerase